MDELVSNLYEVSVRGPAQVGSWRVLVRAVDAESAAGAVRARGHEVIGVRAGEKPKARTGGVPRVSCVNCGYSLTKLPTGEAGEVQCPECGVINTPITSADTVWDELKAQRRATRRVGIGCTLAGVLMATLFLVVTWGLRWMMRKGGLLP
jgi:hypothetical protein